jgi:ubiquinone/menaquinone biosynthesis C-methylase UbiE
VPSDRVITLKERLYKGQVDGTTFFRKLISDQLGPGAYALDLGCGKGNETIDFRSEAALVVGFDIREDIKKNCRISAWTVGDAHHLPFKNESFHLVFMDYVVEHLESPDRCAYETFRVLKPGGSLIVRTPNLYHYVSVIASITPLWFHRLVANRARRLNDPGDQNLFRTFYRANTLRAIKRVFSQAGFLVEQVIMVEREPSYLMFARPAFLLGYWYERLVNRYESLANFRSNIFGIMRKPVQ